MAGFVFISNEGKTMLSDFFELFLKLSLLVIVLTINFCAMSIALICNENEGLFLKIFIAVYAFLFGIIYLFINYYSYRIAIKNETCKYSGSVFPF
jgi:hypothetical protein